MAGILKIIAFSLCMFAIQCETTENESKEELVGSESKDGKLEIIKQIKKVNDDGSYTIGYEADDGSFKIESRDVLGNIKGTYGYIDDTGEIKRVSYSTSNSSELITKAPEVSVVQRIPKITKIPSTTRRPTYHPTQIPSSSTTTLQRLKLRNSLLASTTLKPNYSDVVNVNSEMVKAKNSPVYETSTPKILLQGRPIVRSTPASQLQKSEGQLIRPELVTARPTETPLFRRLSLKPHVLGEDKPVNEEIEEKSNILRRQLHPNFDPRQHLFTIQQSAGSDNADVYSGSVTTGTPRPLFTTTARSRGLISTTAAPLLLQRPTVRYETNQQRNVLQDLEPGPEYVRETTTQGPVEPTPTPVPGGLQIPANNPTQEPLVAIRHPLQRGGTILVPLSQLQNVAEREGVAYVPQRDVYARPTPRPVPVPVPEDEPQPIYVRRPPPPPPQFRPIPVQVDENGYVRNVPQPIPYPPQIPQNLYRENDIDDINPPVSTRDFQKLLQQLIVRQSRLERISSLANQRRYLPERPRIMYEPTPTPFYYPRNVQNRPGEYGPEGSNPQQNARAYPQVPRLNPNYYQDEEQSYVPARRVARLLPNHEQAESSNPEFLPPNVREMLLLRMLQLAMNPAMPTNENDMMDEEAAETRIKKTPVKNVEILGEEEDHDKRASRIKRFKGTY